MKKFLLLLIMFSVFFSSCKSKETVLDKTDIQKVFRNNLDLLEKTKKQIECESISDFYENLNTEERIGQLFLISVDGNNKNNIPDIVKVNRSVPGGYLLFGFNIAETAEDTIDFIAELQNEYLKMNMIPPYMSIDHEGGSVNRLRNICSPLPSQQSVARKFSVVEAEKLYELHGKQLRNLGIHVNLAPIVEIKNRENEQFLENRSFGDKDAVIEYAQAEINGLQKGCVFPVLKHFPGNSSNDPHTGLPVLKCSIQELKSEYVEPFTLLCNEEKTGILVAHTVTPSVDDKPACLSDIMINLLYSEINNFDGLLFSDDLLMKALTDNGFTIENSLIEAINAGINILMIAECRYDEYADILIREYENNEDFHIKVDESVKKILEWKVSWGLLESNIKQTGFFEFKSEIQLPSSIDERQKIERKENFTKAYMEADTLYNKVWWSK